MSHKPRRLVRHTQHAMKLMGAHPLLGRAEKMNSHEPFVQGSVAILKYRVDGNSELLFAASALVQASARGLLAPSLCGDLPRLHAAAMWADRAISFGFVKYIIPL